MACQNLAMIFFFFFYTTGDRNKIKQFLQSGVCFRKNMASVLFGRNMEKSEAN